MYPPTFTSPRLTHARAAAIRCVLTLALVAGASVSTAATPAAARERFMVWVDDQHTRQIEVEQVDPNEIADSSSFKLSASASIGSVSVSIGWSRNKGIEFEQKAQALIRRIETLCEQFNAGELSLETYRRRMRRIFDAVERGRLCRMELLVNTSIESAKAGAKLDRALGLPERDNAAHKRALEATLVEFRELVHGVDQGIGARAQGAVQTGALQQPRQTVEHHLNALDVSLATTDLRKLDASDKITIWADRARTRRIVVPRLDVEHLAEEFEDSLGLRLKCSGPLFSATIGGELVTTLRRKAEYDQSATLLIVKYRALCMDYNSGILSQEAYSDRLLELFEAERRAFDARGRLLDQLDEHMAATRANLDELLGRADSNVMAEMRGRKDEMKATARQQQRDRRPDSLVEHMSRGHQDQMDAWSAFHSAVHTLDVDPPRDPIQVWVDDARTRRVEVSRLDTDLLAQHVETRLTLHIRFMAFGPETEWARERGLEYGAAAQQLIVKSKQLCMDYNADLVPQESFDRRRAAIDASLEVAARLQERAIEFTRQLKGSARDELDRRLKMPRHSGR